MEKRVCKIVDDYCSQFKKDICDKLVEFSKDNIDVQDIVSFVYDYEKIALENDDFAKRKRVKNAVPFCDRCTAKRATGEQCTRRKREGEVFCGTHSKGTPHGAIDINSIDENNQQQVNRVEVWVQEMNGICYYIDKNHNVYQTEDIVSNSKNPKIVAQYNVDANNKYTLITI